MHGRREVCGEPTPTKQYNYTKPQNQRLAQFFDIIA